MRARCEKKKSEQKVPRARDGRDDDRLRAKPNRTSLRGRTKPSLPRSTKLRDLVRRRAPPLVPRPSRGGETHSPRGGGGGGRGALVDAVAPEARASPLAPPPARRRAFGFHRHASARRTARTTTSIASAAICAVSAAGAAAGARGAVMAPAARRAAKRRDAQRRGRPARGASVAQGSGVGRAIAPGGAGTRPRARGEPSRGRAPREGWGVWWWGRGARREVQTGEGRGENLRAGRAEALARRRGDRRACGAILFSHFPASRERIWSESGRDLRRHFSSFVFRVFSPRVFPLESKGRAFARRAPHGSSEPVRVTARAAARGEARERKSGRRARGSRGADGRGCGWGRGRGTASAPPSPPLSRRERPGAEGAG